MSAKALEANLPGGRICVTVEDSLIAPEALFTFAARDNPKRAFLFLSHVLGKHLPTHPLLMQRTHENLAAGIPPLPSPVVFIGMAETATCLGQGVFEAWRQLNGDVPSIYLHSTRYEVKGRQSVCFDEDHSHAPRQWFYLPEGAQATTIFEQARSLVLIDDEISTGCTFANLAKVCKSYAPHLEHTHLCCLTDFAGAVRAEIPERFDTPISTNALLRGSWMFEHNSTETHSPDRSSAQAAKAPVITDHGYGRLGLIAPLALHKPDLAAIADGIERNERVLVLGTGEFMHAPYQLAMALVVATDARVHTHSTTRSPILQWGPIQKSFSFADNYGEGVPNFLYNFERSDYEHVFLCHEAGANHNLDALATPLDATLLSFHNGGRIERATETVIYRP